MKSIVSLVVVSFLAPFGCLTIIVRAFSMERIGPSQGFYTCTSTPFIRVALSHRKSLPSHNSPRCRCWHATLGKNNDDNEDDKKEEDIECSSAAANEVTEDDEMTELMRSLKERQAQLVRDEESKSIKLRKAACKSGVSLVLPDWVRRVDVDYPLAVCGSASDIVYLAHLETGQVLSSTNNNKNKNKKATETTKKSSTESASSSVPPLNLKITEARVEHVVNQLYGRFDGGGTLAVCIKGNLMAESRRTGGLHIWRLNSSAAGTAATTTTALDSAAATAPTSVDLVWQGFIPSLQDCLVTALRIEDDFLWVGTDDGSVEAFALDDDEIAFRLPLTLRTHPDLSWKVGTGGTGVVVMSLDVCPKLRCAVIATDSGTIELLSYDDDDDDDDDENDDDVENQCVAALTRTPIGSFTPPFDGTERRSFNVHPTCATFVMSNKDPTIEKPTTVSNDFGAFIGAIKSANSTSSSSSLYSIACGANDGSLYLHPLNLDSFGDVDKKDPFSGPRPRQLMPQHFASVKCMNSPAPGLLLTGGLDGTLRLWDTDIKKFMYQFVGYKVWLGSLWTDGERIITDGADNTIIVHDFSGDTSVDERRRGGTN